VHERAYTYTQHTHKHTQKQTRQTGHKETSSNLHDAVALVAAWPHDTTETPLTEQRETAPLDHCAEGPYVKASDAHSRQDFDGAEQHAKVSYEPLPDAVGGRIDAVVREYDVVPGALHIGNLHNTTEVGQANAGMSQYSHVPHNVAGVAPHDTASYVSQGAVFAQSKGISPNIPPHGGRVTLLPGPPSASLNTPNARSSKIKLKPLPRSRENNSQAVASWRAGGAFGEDTVQHGHAPIHTSISSRGPACPSPEYHPDQRLGEPPVHAFDQLRSPAVLSFARPRLTEAASPFSTPILNPGPANHGQNTGAGWYDHNDMQEKTAHGTPQRERPMAREGLHEAGAGAGRHAGYHDAQQPARLYPPLP
jgi:hypothetical protein